MVASPAVRASALAVTLALALAFLFALSGAPRAESPPRAEHRLFSSSSARGAARGAAPSAAPVSGRALVVFAYTKADARADDNLRHFLRAGVTAHDGRADYVIVVSGGALAVDAPELHAPHVTVLRRVDACAGSGAYSAALVGRNLSRYSHFIFVNSSVRGPFLPLYARRAGVHWTRAFTALIDETVKWAGASISCATHPHVQAAVFVTDAEGLGIVSRAGVFECRAATPEAAAWELGASRAILDAGFNLGSLMARHDGVDFRSVSACNAGADPSQRGGNDGFDLDPFEVVFVDSGAGRSRMVRRYSDYLFELDDLWEDSSLANEVPEQPRGLANCRPEFDADYYLAVNEDLRKNWKKEAAAHWANHGESERRTHRFIAGPNTTDTPACRRLLGTYAWGGRWKPLTVQPL
jgi:hypothetical protein